MVIRLTVPKSIAMSLNIRRPYKIPVGLRIKSELNKKKLKKQLEKNVKNVYIC